MNEQPHIKLEASPKEIPFKSTKRGSLTQVNPSRDAGKHSAKLKSEIQALVKAEAGVSNEFRNKYSIPSGSLITIESDREYKLKLESLDDKGAGIKVVSFKIVDQVEIANLSVPSGRFGKLLKKVEDFGNTVLLNVKFNQADEPKLEAINDDAKGIKFSKSNTSGKASIRCPVSEQSRITFEIEKFADVTGFKPRNEALIASIARIRAATLADLWQGESPFPANGAIWWEVWLHCVAAQADQIHKCFVELASSVGLKTSERFITFPEHVVLLAFGTAAQLSSSTELLSMLAELRKAAEIATPYLDLPSQFQGNLAKDLVSRTTPAEMNAPTVCVLDSGVNRGHLLLEHSISESEAFAVNPDWGSFDHEHNQHGTGMAGNALYGCLTEVLNTSSEIVLRHRLESVKILPRFGKNDPDVYGDITDQATSLPISVKPNVNRVYCMAVTADPSNGLPTSWSGAVDDICSGRISGDQKLMFVSAGNIRDFADYQYPSTNQTAARIEDPAQAWNAITVGAVTQKVMIQDEQLANWQPIAPNGDLSPTSRTSLAWPDSQYRGWPIKPDIVCEGGNRAFHQDETIDHEDLSLLSTYQGASGQFFQAFRETSAATALAARMAAIIWSHYPELWPETVRGLMIHSATWTPAMLDRFPGKRKEVVLNRLRCYGFGVPNLDRALWTLNSRVTLISEQMIQPFKGKNSNPKFNVMHLHELPWDVNALRSLGETKITMRVTLSYFVEPSPGEVGWGRTHRYQSHGLRFELKRPTQKESDFRSSINKIDQDGTKTAKGDSHDWTLGSNNQKHGSIHSDWWTGTAANLADSNLLAVVPVGGWWRERSHLDSVKKQTRYSLIVTIESPEQDVDLLTPVLNATKVPTTVQIDA